MHQQRVAEQVEIVCRVAVALGQVLQPVRDIINAQGCIQTGGFQQVEGQIAPTGDLADQVEVFLPDFLSELMNDRAEEARRPGVHVLDRIDAEPVDVGIGDPELIHLA